MTQPFHSFGCFPECGVLSPPQPHSHLKGSTEARPSQEPFPPHSLPLHSGAGWETAEKGQLIVLTGNTQRPADATCLTVLPSTVTFLQQLNASPGSARPCSCT